MEISNGYHQAMASHHPVLDHEALGCPEASASQQVQQQLLQDQKKPRPQAEHALRCPRCDSTNTKFCYYNNYSLSQPRYFCKGCRRYWTKGGSLRNVPVGGGCRKNKRTSPSTSNSSSSSAKKSSSTLHQPADRNDNFPTNPIATSASLLTPTMPFHTLTYEPNHDLTLAFDPFLLGNNHNPNPSHGPVPTSTTGPAGFLEMLRSGFVESTPSNEGGGFQSLYYGFGGGSGGGGDHLRGMLSFDGCVGGSDSTTASAATGVVLLQANADPASNANAGHGSLGMDSGKDYWNGVGSSSSWHGLINSSLL